jgi:hypothetical protein
MSFINIIVHISIHFLYLGFAPEYSTLYVNELDSFCSNMSDEIAFSQSALQHVSYSLQAHRHPARYNGRTRRYAPTFLGDLAIQIEIMLLCHFTSPIMNTANLRRNQRQAFCARWD